MVSEDKINSKAFPKSREKQIEKTNQCAFCPKGKCRKINLHRSSNKANGKQSLY